MLKKIMLFLLCAVMVFTCVSCGKKNDSEGKMKNKESVSVKESELYSNFNLNQSTITKASVFSKDGVTVKLTDITYEDVTTKIDFRLKNDTDKKVKVVTADFSVNGLMCTDAMMCDVEAKTEKDSYIEISNEWFAELNIDTIKNMDYTIRVLDEQNNEIIRSGVINAVTDAPKDYEQKYDEEGFIIYNSDGIVFAAREVKKSKLSNDMELSFYVENNTDRSFSISASDVSVNGTPIEPTFVITVGANKKAVDSMLFHEADLTAGRIGEFKTVSASFKAFNDNLETVFETQKVEIPVQ